MAVNPGPSWKDIKKIRAFESKAHIWEYIYRRLINITYKQRQTNIYVSTEIRKKNYTVWAYL